MIKRLTIFCGNSFPYFSWLLCKHINQFADVIIVTFLNRCLKSKPKCIISFKLFFSIFVLQFSINIFFLQKHLKLKLRIYSSYLENTINMCWYWISSVFFISLKRRFNLYSKWEIVPILRTWSKSFFLFVA